MLDLIDHAANCRGIFQCPGPVHFIEPQTNQSLALIFAAADRAADLSYGNSCFCISHGLMPFLFLPGLLLPERHHDDRQYR